ncbi:hypothetical protein PSN45_000239 [Yamadazyma tenuis]|uniref:Gem-associated protein 2 n=1 Tax=Candida tenuis (strain ATCC 10573 / BCRC 21748 / CBS 615 / JCM 9827 / NBRC 10315 / NRRL Y-1498 / VKM Y-70) TaxID=590646 RepID=G3BBK5_CANTC|nr:uncharacterized protein CANTEDRAFT_94450 [Yamadazyma tenuis ATCC 10573]EGV61561.1 hypothetical protein CANTEDRAFT_94450 [Yamadazyma tenuis ATCC 10573]WEJ92783.1 hypothetical protein PSN45_000239 [Yamadazyma tenuis]
MKRRLQERDSSRDKSANEVIPVEYEEVIEGIPVQKSAVYEYLASVRQEAETVSYMTPTEVASDSTSEKLYQSDSSTEFYINTNIGNVQLEEPLEKWKNVFLKDFRRTKSQIDSDLSLERSSHPPWEQPESASLWRKYVIDNPPPAFEVIQYQFDHITAMRLLVHLTSWLSNKTNDNLSQWIYCLLLRTDSVLEYSDCAIIRGLGKKAVKLLQKSENDAAVSSTAKYTFEFIVLLVCHYYHQKDII